MPVLLQFREKIGILVVDEADYGVRRQDWRIHCDLDQIAEKIKAFQTGFQTEARIPVLVATATGDVALLDAFCEATGLWNIEKSVLAFDRPFRYHIHERSSRDDILKLVENYSSPVIIFLGVQKQGGEIMHVSEEKGVSATFCHGGEKSYLDDFSSGKARVLVAISSVSQGYSLLALDHCSS